MIIHKLYYDAFDKNNLTWSLFSNIKPLVILQHNWYLIPNNDTLKSTFYFYCLLSINISLQVLKIICLNNVYVILYSS